MTEWPKVTELISRVMEDVSTRITVSDTGCWLWNGAKSANGYGQIQRNGRQEGVHRYVYRHLHGDDSVKGLVIDHLCRVRACCNPDHLQAVQQRVNLARGVNQVAAFMVATHCVNGHEFTPENTYRTTRGARNCRACVRINMRRFRARKAEA